MFKLLYLALTNMDNADQRLDIGIESAQYHVWRKTTELLNKKPFTQSTLPALFKLKSQGFILNTNILKPGKNFVDLFRPAQIRHSVRQRFSDTLASALVSTLPDQVFAQRYLSIIKH